jgi:hypothetical protein
MGQLSALSGLRGLRVLRLELKPPYHEAGLAGAPKASPADALATLARSHPALEKVRCLLGGGLRGHPPEAGTDCWPVLCAREGKGEFHRRG